jgi:hypothetical protein
MTDKERITQLEARIALLETRIMQLEARPYTPTYVPYPVSPYPSYPRWPEIWCGSKTSGNLEYFGHQQ